MDKNTLIIYYDSYCPLCTKTKEKWSSMDKYQLLTFVSFRDEQILNSLPFPLNALEKEIYSRKPNSEVYYKGVGTFIEMNKRIPYLKLTTPFLVVLNKIGLASLVYKYVAMKRKIVPVGHCNHNQCTVNFSNKTKNL